MSNPDEPRTLRLRPRPSEQVTLSIPSDTLELIDRVAATRDMSADALLKFYIGQGLRQDAARLIPIPPVPCAIPQKSDTAFRWRLSAQQTKGNGMMSERIMQTTAKVLARHIASEEERSAILSEIQGAAA